jgi:phosphoribosylanthranilate isomerase
MTKIKICGLFREEDIAFVNAARPDYIGFVFAPSPRQVSRSQAARLRSALREGIVPVGVFVNAPLELILALFQEGTIQAAQLHGSEDAAYITALKAGGSLPVIKAIGVKTAADSVGGEREPAPADYLLLDQGSGGTGQPFDWDQIGRPDKPYFLAGGINSSNISRALAYRPYGIDISSGAETAGVKDRGKILDLVQRVRGEA